MNKSELPYMVKLIVLPYSVEDEISFGKASNFNWKNILPNGMDIEYSDIEKVRFILTEKKEN